MCYLIDKGWTPCADVTHTHAHAGDRTMLHPPGDVAGRVSTRAQLATFDAALFGGFPARAR